MEITVTDDFLGHCDQNFTHTHTHTHIYIYIYDFEDLRLLKT